MNENNLSDIISSLSKNPEISKMVERFKESGDFSSILGEVSSLLADKESNEDEDGTRVEENTENEEAKSSNSEEKKEANADFDTSEAFSLLGKILPSLSKSISESASLLIALKPYLNKKRCDLIDGMIKISKLASIVSLTK